MIAIYVGAGLLAACALAFLAWKTLILTAAPDEWLLRIRHGQLVQSGVGVMMLRRPGDIFARFSSTVQRVGFTTETWTSDRIKVTVTGFMLWAVSDENDAPFQAFRSLGLANLLDPPSDLAHPKHLLTKPQYRAFQQIVSATAQRFASTIELEALLRNQEAFVTGLSRRLADDIEARGIRIQQVEVLNIQATDPEIMAALCAKEDERIREEAASIRLETAERVATRTREKETREAKEEANARRDRQAHEALANLELEEQRAELLAQQNSVQIQQIQSQAQIKEEKQRLDHELAKKKEERAKALLDLKLLREHAELDFQSTRTRSEAEAKRDAALAILQVEAEKSQELRDHELAQFTADKVASMLKIQDGRWVSIGESPGASLGALFETVREIMAVPKSGSSPS